MSESKQAPVARLHIQGGEIAGACVWREELEHNGTLYETSCGQPFVLDEPPSEVGMRYCCFCGRRLQQESRSDE